jgi:hypothetical protein
VIKTDIKIETFRYELKELQEKMKAQKWNLSLNILEDKRMMLEQDGLNWKLSINLETRAKPSQLIKKHELVIKEAITNINPTSIYVTAILIVNEKPFNFISPPADDLQQIIDGCIGLEANITKVINLTFHFICESQDVGERTRIVEAF